MKGGAIIKMLAREENEVVHRLGCILGKQVTNDLPLRRIDRCRILLVGINRHRGRSGVFFGHTSSVPRYRTSSDSLRSATIQRMRKGGGGIENSKAAQAVSAATLILQQRVHVVVLEFLPPMQEVQLQDKSEARHFAC